MGRDNVPTTYLDYYNTKYRIRIRSDSQPLLVARSTQRDRRAGKDEIIYLVPELCRATGIFFFIYTKTEWLYTGNYQKI